MKRHIQFFILLTQAFCHRHKKHIGLGILIGFLGTILFLQAYPLYEKLVEPKTQKIGIIGKFNQESLPLNIQNKISLGLTSITSDGMATASLAKKWELDSQEKTYVLYLHSDIYWHDGKLFKAKDINYKIKEATLTPLDDYSIKVNLKEPYAALPILLSRPLLKPNLIGLGIYKVSKIKYSGEYISELILQSLSNKFESLIYKFYRNLEDAILAFKLGEIDYLENINSIDDLVNSKNIKIEVKNDFDSYIGILFNLKNSLFKERDVRYALSYALPNMENVTKTFTPISPLSWAYSSKVRLFRYDPEAANKILSKIEFSSKSSEITISSYASLLQTAQFVADAWKKVGLNVKIKVINTIPEDYQVLIISHPIPIDPDQYLYWQSTQAQTNITHYTNLKVDKLLEDGRKTSDREKRKKIYADFQRYLVDDAPVIFLYYPKVYTVERK